MAFDVLFNFFTNVNRIIDDINKIKVDSARLNQTHIEQARKQEDLQLRIDRQRRSAFESLRRFRQDEVNFTNRVAKAEKALQEQRERTTSSLIQKGRLKDPAAIERARAGENPAVKAATVALRENLSIEKASLDVVKARVGEVERELGILDRRSAKIDNISRKEQRAFQDLKRKQQADIQDLSAKAQQTQAKQQRLAGLGFALAQTGIGPLQAVASPLLAFAFGGGPGGAALAAGGVAIGGIVKGLGAVKDLLVSVVSTAADFRDELLLSQQVVAGLIAQTVTLVDSQGRLIPETEKFNEAQKIAASLQKDLLGQVLETNVTFREANEAVQSSLGLLVQKGIDFQKAQELIVIFTALSKNLGFVGARAAREVSGLIRGEVNALTTAVRAAGITTKDLREKVGKDLLAILEVGSSQLKKTIAESTKLLSVQVGNIKDNLLLLLAEAFDPTAARIVKRIDEILKSFRSATGELSVEGQRVKAAFEDLFKGIGDVFEKIFTAENIKAFTSSLASAVGIAKELFGILSSISNLTFGGIDGLISSLKLISAQLKRAELAAEFIQARLPSLEGKGDLGVAEKFAAANSLANKALNAAFDVFAKARNAGVSKESAIKLAEDFINNYKEAFENKAKGQAPALLKSLQPDVAKDAGKLTSNEENAIIAKAHSSVDLFVKSQKDAAEKSKPEIAKAVFSEVKFITREELGDVKSLAKLQRIKKAIQDELAGGSTREEQEAAKEIRDAIKANDEKRRLEAVKRQREIRQKLGKDIKFVIPGAGDDLQEQLRVIDKAIEAITNKLEAIQRKKDRINALKAEIAADKDRLRELVAERQEIDEQVAATQRLFDAEGRLIDQEDQRGTRGFERRIRAADEAVEKARAELKARRDIAAVNANNAAVMEKQLKLEEAIKNAQQVRIDAQQKLDEKVAESEKKLEILQRELSVRQKILNSSEAGRVVVQQQEVVERALQDAIDKRTQAQERFNEVAREADDKVQAAREELKARQEIVKSTTSEADKIRANISVEQQQKALEQAIKEAIEEKVEAQDRFNKEVAAVENKVNEAKAELEVRRNALTVVQEGVAVSQQQLLVEDAVKKSIDERTRAQEEFNSAVNQAESTVAAARKELEIRQKIAESGLNYEAQLKANLAVTEQQQKVEESLIKAGRAREEAQKRLGELIRQSREKTELNKESLSQLSVGLEGKVDQALGLSGAIAQASRLDDEFESVNKTLVRQRQEIEKIIRSLQADITAAKNLGFGEDQIEVIRRMVDENRDQLDVIDKIRDAYAAILQLNLRMLEFQTQHEEIGVREQQIRAEIALAEQQAADGIIKQSTAFLIIRDLTQQLVQLEGNRRDVLNDELLALGDEADALEGQIALEEARGNNTTRLRNRLRLIKLEQDKIRVSIKASQTETNKLQNEFGNVYKTILQAAGVLEDFFNAINLPQVAKLSRSFGEIFKGLKEVFGSKGGIGKFFKDIKDIFKIDKKAAGGGILGSVFGVLGKISKVAGPIGAVISGAMTFISTFSAVFKRAAQNMAKDIEKSVKEINASFDAGRINLAEALNQLQAQYNKTYELSRKKGGKELAQKLREDLEPQIVALQKQQRDILEGFNFDIALLRLRKYGDAWADLASTIRDAGSRIAEFIGAGGTIATAQEYLNEILDKFKRDLQDSIDNQQTAALERAQRLIDLNRELEQMEIEHQRNVEEIRSEGLLSRQLTFGQSKARRIAEENAKYLEQKKAITEQIDLNKQLLEIDKQILPASIDLNDAEKIRLELIKDQVEQRQKEVNLVKDQLRLVAGFIKDNQGNTVLDQELFDRLKYAGVFHGAGVKVQGVQITFNVDGKNVTGGGFTLNAELQRQIAAVAQQTLDELMRQKLIEDNSRLGYENPYLQP